MCGSDMSMRAISAPTEACEPAVLFGDSARSVRSWYAVYTRSRCEKRVAQSLSERGVENYLPLCKKLRNWSDRQVAVDFPLFPGYVFVRISGQEKLRVLSIDGTVCLVGTARGLVPIADREIEQLRRYLSHGQVEPHPCFKAGARARITSGPLKGIEGVLVQERQVLRLVLAIEAANLGAAVRVTPDQICVIGTVS
jgi:transcription antitermination factor NusG